MWRSYNTPAFSLAALGDCPRHAPARHILARCMTSFLLFIQQLQLAQRLLICRCAPCNLLLLSAATSAGSVVSTVRPAPSMHVRAEGSQNCRYTASVCPSTLQSECCLANMATACPESTLMHSTPPALLILLCFLRRCRILHSCISAHRDDAHGKRHNSAYRSVCASRQSSAASTPQLCLKTM